MDYFKDVKKILLDGWHPFAWIIGLGFLIYFQIIGFDFSYFDDQELILNNFLFLGDFSNVFKAFAQDVFQTINTSDAYYRPLLTISLMIDAVIAGAGPHFFHFTNLILHLVSASLLFVFLRKLRYRKDLSFFFSLIFVVHPVLTQAIAWIPGRNDSLLTIFALSSFIFFIQYLNRKKINDLVWHMLFFLLAMLTKETAVFIPVVCLSFMYFIRKINFKDIFEEKNIFRVIIPWASITLVWWIVRSLVLAGNKMDLSLWDAFVSMFNKLPNSILFIGKVLLPFNLSVLPSMDDSTLWLGALSVILISLGIFFSKTKRKGYIIFGIIWFFIFLIPTFISPDSGHDLSSLEHRIYLPFIGFLIILLEMSFIKQMNFSRKNIQLISILVIIALSIITLSRSGDFKNRMSFWQSAVRTSPSSPLANRNMGAMLQLDGLNNLALPYYEEALKLNPTEEMVYNNLGLIYMNNGSFGKAEEAFLKELEHNPDYDVGLYNLGLLYYKQNRVDKTIDMWKKTLSVNPDYYDAKMGLFILQEQKNKIENNVKIR